MQIILFAILIAVVWYSVDAHGPDGVAVGIGYFIAGGLMIFAYGMIAGAMRSLASEKQRKRNSARMDWDPLQRPQDTSATWLLVFGTLGGAAGLFILVWVNQNLVP